MKLLGCSLIQYDLCLHKKGKFEHRDNERRLCEKTQREHQVKMEAEIEIMPTQANKHLQLPEAGKGKEKILFLEH